MSYHQFRLTPPGSGGGGITISSTAITGGVNKRVLFDDNGVVGEDAGFTYDKATDTITLTTAGTTLTLSPTGITGNNDVGGAIVLKENGGNNVFRGVRTTGWADSVTMTFFQVGTTNDNSAFTAASGGVFTRFLVTSLGFQVGAAQYNIYPAPVALVEFWNDFGSGSNRVPFWIIGNRTQAVNLSEWYEGGAMPATGNLAMYVSKNGWVGSQMGVSNTMMVLLGLADVQTSSSGVGNTADTNDDTLFTYTLPSNSMSANGKSVRAIATGHFATNANSKRVKMWFAGTAIADSGVLTLSNVDWKCEIEVTRIDATHVSCVGRFTGSNVADVITVTANLVVSDLTANTSIIKTTGASTIVGAANDILSYMQRTEFMN